uniref:Protein kinase domain-containing protein n=1 Tax=Salmo trutta TaxID=8032 RepID=A0A674F429_SALTR
MIVKFKSNATFVTKIVGHPIPAVKWYKNGKEIVSDGVKIKLQEFKGGYYQLIIANAEDSDTGVYQELAAREIETLNLAKHKNFMYLHESFDSLEEMVLIYEFISGVDIFERLGTGNFELSELEIVRYLRQVCSALKFLHKLNYAHFEIKPDNIVYTTRKSTNIKIIEMGQARLLTPGENIRINFTAPEYCAPEVHCHGLVSTATDMWSVGVLTYVLLSGLNPFAAESTTKMIENISNAEYIFDSEAFKETSIEGMDFCDRLLCKDLKKRMTAHEALEHSWLRLKLEHLSTKTIKTLRHRRYYQTAQRGVTVAKVKIAPFEHGPVGGQIIHTVVDVGADVKFACNIENYDSATEVTCGNVYTHLLYSAYTGVLVSTRSP